MKSEAYSWRVSTDMKTELEVEAHRRKISLAGLLDLAACELLSKSRPRSEDDEEQRRLQAAASKCFAAFAGHDAHRSENARKELRRRLRLQRQNGR